MLPGRRSPSSVRRRAISSRRCSKSERDWGIRWPSYTERIIYARKQPPEKNISPFSLQSRQPFTHLHVDTFTYVCQCGCIGIVRKWRLCTSDERGLALTFLVRPGDEFTSPQPSATSPFVSTSGKPLRLA